MVSDDIYIIFIDYVRVCWRTYVLNVEKQIIHGRSLFLFSNFNNYRILRYIQKYV